LQRYFLHFAVAARKQQGPPHLSVEGAPPSS
jgi:hypothetical protein